MPGKTPGKEIETAEPPVSGAREWIFRGLALVLAPCLLLITFEGLLRLVGFGYATPFLVEGKRSAEGQTRLVSNPRFGWRFFPPTLARRPELLEAVVPAPDPTFRVALVGGSAAMGIPEPAFGMGRMLEAMLGESFPERDIEVLNAAMTAINSHVVRVIVDDVLRARPDVVVIYMGNNEVVGPWGAGSVLGRARAPRPAIRAGILLRSLRLGQLLDELTLGWRSSGSEPTGWRGMALFAEQRVARSDPGLDRVYENFAANLEAILQTLGKAAVPVILSTVGVDLLDTPPFAGEPSRPLDETEAAQLEASLHATLDAARSGLGAREQLDRLGPALAIDSEHADVAYLEGRARVELGHLGRPGADPGELRAGVELLGLARDLDELRFRTDSRIQEILRQAGKARDSVVLVDAEHRLSQASVAGVPGADLFWEHVHLKPAGNWVVARALFEAVAPLVDEEQPGSGALAIATPPSEARVRELLALTPWHETRIYQDIVEMMEAPPFTQQIGHRKAASARRARLARLQQTGGGEGAIRDAESAVRRALENRPRDAVLLRSRVAILRADDREAEAIAEMEALADRWPEQPGLWTDLGNTLLGADQLDRAEAAYRRAMELDPHMADLPFDLGIVDIRRGELAVAIEHFEQALALDPGHMGARLDRAAALERLGKAEAAFEAYAEAVKVRPDHAQARTEYGARLAQAGRLEEAVAQYEAALEHRESHAPAYYNLGVTLVRLGDLDGAVKAYAGALRHDPSLDEARDNLVDAHNRRGAVLAQSGDISGAIDAFRRAAAAHPDHGPTLFNLARALAMAGRQPAALETLYRARESTLVQGPTELLPQIDEGILALGGALPPSPSPPSPVGEGPE